MKSTKWLVVALVLFTSFPILTIRAQQAGVSANAQQSASASAAGASVNQSAGANAGASASAPQMRPVSGELVGKLDSKTARVGDTVILKTTANVRGADGVVIPKGSRLVGHVTEVHAREKGSEDGSLAMQFDRAELKSGQTLAIHSVIESVSPSASDLTTASADTDDSFVGGVGGARSSGSGRTVGGLTGGALSTGGGLAGGTSSALGTTTTAAGSGLSSAGNGALNTAGNVSGSASAATAGGLQTAAAGTAGLGAHATAIPGLMLAGDASGATSGTLSASRKNVHLDSGTQFVLGVAAAGH
jgi:hypothetical protein